MNGDISKMVRKMGLGALSVLGDDILFFILKYLEIKDLLRFGAASRLASIFSNQEFLWKKLCLRKCGREVLYNHKKKSWKDSCFYSRYIEEEVPRAPSFTVEGLSPFFD